MKEKKHDSSRSEMHRYIQKRDCHGMGYIPELRESLSKPDWRYCRVCSGNAVWFKSE